MNETWKSIKDYEGLYEICNSIKVRSVGRLVEKDGILSIIPIESKELKIFFNKKGYGYIKLAKNKKQKGYYIHRLIAQAFIANPDNKPHVNHKDKNKANNTISNLEWVTQLENNTHSRLNNPTFASKYLGVCWDKWNKRWKATIRLNGKNIHIGVYLTELEAHDAYEKAVKEAKETGTFTKVDRNPKYSSKYLGVSFNKQSNKWLARYNGKYIGSFESEEQAANAIKEAA